MTEPRKFKLWGRKRTALAVLLLLALPVAVAALIGSGWADSYVRRAVAGQLEKMTGGRVELTGFHFDPWRLTATLDGLTIHGREPAGAPPFVHVDHLGVGLRIDSLWQHKISVGDVEVLRPAVNVHVAADGSSNVPAPKNPGPPGKPIRQRLFELVVRQLRIEDGVVNYNDARVPFAAEGGLMNLAVDYAPADVQGRPAYLGDFRWQQTKISPWKDVPFNADVMARFTLEPDSLAVTQLVVALPHTYVDGQISLDSFVHPALSFRYRGQLNFEDLQVLVRNPGIPNGFTDFMGEGKFADGQLALNGQYNAQQIGFKFQWFHGKDIVSRASYHADSHNLEVPDFQAHVLGGVMTGRVYLTFKGLHFRAETHTDGMDLSTLLTAVDNANLPVLPLHWHGVMNLDDVTTWDEGFKRLDSQGTALWMPPAQVGAGEIPATAQLHYHYNMVAADVAIQPSEISTPTSTVQFSGVLGGHNSSLLMSFDTQDLTTWDDFINHIRGKNATQVIAGTAHWQGQLNGPLSGPTFTGHVRGTNARYDRLVWDQIEGDLRYGPDGFSLTRANASTGRSSAQMELSLTLDDWNFRPENPWSFDVTVVRTEFGGLQSLFDTSYPVSGLLSGDFHGSGTRAMPEFHGLFDIVSPDLWGWKLDRARGEFSYDHEQVRVFNAELRLPPPPAPAGSPAGAAGVITGNLSFGRLDRQVQFNLTGAVLPLESIARIQTPRVPIGGQLSFQMSGQGPLLAPKLDGAVRLVDLRLGPDVVGSFQGQLDSDGSRLRLQLDSAITPGSLHGEADVALSGVYPLTGKIEVAQLNLNPLLKAALHLNAFTAPSQVDGDFTLGGALLDPSTLALQANLSRVAFAYQNVNLENTAPIQFEYRQNEIRVMQASFKGPESDFRVAGFARFAGDRMLAMNVSGGVNLRLLGAFVPHLDAAGPAQIDAAIFGTLSTPRVTGRAHLQDASIRYGDFPAGLSNVAGDFVFDTTRLVFDNVSAEIGGGQMTLGGALSYDGAARYDVTATANQVRIRYPVGMSWHSDATLRLTGTAQGATLSGRVTVDRLLLADNFDFASLLSSSSESVAAPLTSSAFLNNLQLDVEANTTPDAVLEGSSGRFQAEGDVRLRGTWENPVVLGNVHMLSGEMEFRGNHYQLTRGDVNFNNPFHLDPVLNIEASTRILEYDVSVSFSGPSSHLTMDYRSDPPLPSSDVISLLALGQTGQESALRGLNSAQNTQVGATTLLSEAVSSQIGGRVQRLFGISHFSVDPFLAGPTSTTQNAAARVTVEQRFSSDLTVTYVTNVTSTQEQVIQIEYTLNRDLSLVALRDENGTFGVDLIRRTHFK